MLNFIVNAHSGRGKGQKTLKKIIDYCYKNKLEYTVHLTSAQGHATRIAKALCENNSSTIIAVGGDGTFHEVLNGITSFEKTTIGFIPSGRGNDFVKGVGIPLDTNKALDIIRAGKTCYIDYIQVGEKRCLNVAGTGLDVDVLQRVAGKQGKISYVSSLIYCLKNFEPYNISIETEGGDKRDFSCIMIGVCNGKQFGGGIKLSPLSKEDDGLMNVVIMSIPEDKKIFKALGKFLKGKHLNLPFTTHFTAKEIKISTDKPHPIQIDGEIYENLDFTCRLIKGGIKTFALK